MELKEKQMHILKVAEKLFAENGFDGTSVRNIAYDADVNVAMISYYFGSKEKLLETLMVHGVSSFRSELSKKVALEMSYEDRLDEIVELIVHRIHKKRRLYKIVHSEFSNTTRELNFKEYTNQKLENYRVIETFVKDGQKAGAFIKQVDIQLLMPTILGTYFSFYYNKRFYKMLIPLDSDVAVESYVHQNLTKHIQQTIKSLLTNEI